MYGVLNERRHYRRFKGADLNQDLGNENVHAAVHTHFISG